MTLPEDREYFNSPSVYRGSTPKGGGSFKVAFWTAPFLFFVFSTLFAFLSYYSYHCIVVCGVLLIT